MSCSNFNKDDLVVWVFQGSQRLNTCSNIKKIGSLVQNLLLISLFSKSFLLISELSALAFSWDTSSFNLLVSSSRKIKHLQSGLFVTPHVEQVFQSGIGHRWYDSVKANKLLKSSLQKQGKQLYSTLQTIFFWLIIFFIDTNFHSGQLL